MSDRFPPDCNYESRVVNEKKNLSILVTEPEQFNDIYRSRGSWWIDCQSFSNTHPAPITIDPPRWVSTLSRNTNSHQVFGSTSFCEYSSLWNAKFRFDLNEQRKLKERWQITFHELLKAPQNIIFFKKIIKINNNSNLPSKLCFSANIQFSDTSADIPSALRVY